MNTPWRSCHRVLAVYLFIALPGAVRAQAPGGQPVARNVPEIKFAPVPGLPTCGPGAVESGDPRNGPSVILARISAGCTIPWHWHTPNENLMLVSGVAHIQARDGKPLTLRAGGFALMPSRHAHQFRCTTACLLYVYSDAAFDIHYVDDKGTEIAPDAALKSVKETAARLPR